MTVPLEIDFREATDRRYEQLHFKQAGLKGFKLPGCWLYDFVRALEMPRNIGKICICQDYWLEMTNTTTSIHKSSIDLPLMSIDLGQHDRLLTHLKSTYATLL